MSSGIRVSEQNSQPATRNRTDLLLSEENFKFGTILNQVYQKNYDQKIKSTDDFYADWPRGNGRQHAVRHGRT